MATKMTQEFHKRQKHQSLQRKFDLGKMTYKTLINSLP